MHINPAWRILTIGDGDLSFSASLAKYHKPAKLTATVFDCAETLDSKYGYSYKQSRQNLEQLGCEVLMGFDVTKPQTWGDLVKHSFDLVIFQFPLIPAFSSKAEFEQQGKYSKNVLNRWLLRNYLQNCFAYFLDEQGENIACITSKDVKPYSHWNIETSIIRDTNINYLGKVFFDIRSFPQYQIRNVDRDKHVKATTCFTYVYSTHKKPSAMKHIIEPDSKQHRYYCPLCKAGPFGSEQDTKAHQNTVRHQRMLAFEKEWVALCQNGE